MTLGPCVTINSYRCVAINSYYCVAISGLLMAFCVITAHVLCEDDLHKVMSTILVLVARSSYWGGTR